MILILSSDSTKISDKIMGKIKQVVKDQEDRDFLYELLSKGLIYRKTEEALQMKKEFKLILAQRFPFTGSEKE